jgi:hypothetical protein
LRCRSATYEYDCPVRHGKADLSAVPPRQFHAGDGRCTRRAACHALRRGASAWNLDPLRAQHAAAGSMSKPVENKSNSTENDSKPVENKRNSAGLRSKPVENESNSTGLRSKPVENDSNSTGNESKPVENDSNSTGFGSKPVEFDSFRVVAAAMRIAAHRTCSCRRRCPAVQADHPASRGKDVDEPVIALQTTQNERILIEPIPDACV